MGMDEGTERTEAGLPILCRLPCRDQCPLPCVDLLRKMIIDLAVAPVT